MEPRFALVNPPYGNDTTSMMPLGLAALGSYLLANNYDVTGYDFSNSRKSVSELAHEYRLGGFDAVGISIYNSNATLAFDLAASIKSISPSTSIIAGGPHATATINRMLQNHPYIDVVVEGEGERPMRELLSSWQSPTQWVQIPGIAFRQGEKYVITGNSKPVSDLDSLPSPNFPFVTDGPIKNIKYFDRSLNRFRNAMPLVTSRSCPFSCNFCAIILIGRQWRKRSAYRVVEDVKLFERQTAEPVEHVYFLDANFFVQAKRSLEIANTLQENWPGITFSFSTRVNQLIRGQSYLQELRSLGLRAVELGIESGSQKALIRFAKDTTVSQNYEAIRLLRENDIELLLDFIMFDAEATLDDIKSNLAFIEESGLDHIVPWDHLLSHMTPYLGTEIRSRYELLLRRQFNDDQLPEPATLFVDDKVRAVFLEFEHIKHYLTSLRDKLLLIEDKLDSASGKLRVRLMLNAASIRRLPFDVLRTLVAQVDQGDPVNLEAAIPELLTDKGTLLTLGEYCYDTLY